MVWFQVSLSVLLTALGVIVAALGDFSFDLLGYIMALTSVAFQVILRFAQPSGYNPNIVCFSHCHGLMYVCNCPVIY
jgi:hypothetical protein